MSSFSFSLIIMINISYDEIIVKIREKSNLSDSEITERIKAKMDQLAGLISKEGAAHIVANELGIKLLEQTAGKLQIKNILSGMRSVETIGKVMQIFDVRDFQSQNRSGRVGSIVIGDETGSIRVVFWGDQTNNMKKLKLNDIIKVKNAYVRENRDQKEIHLNDRAVIFINPEGESVDAVKAGTDCTRKKIKELSETDSNVELFGTIVQVFDLRFFETCPECGKRAKQREDGFYCNDHNGVFPSYSYVTNFFLDDGSESIRVVCFRTQVEQLFKKKNEEVLMMKDSSEQVDAVKNELLGNMVKVSGRVTINTMFDRLEFISQNIDMNPDPEEELRRLEQES